MALVAYPSAGANSYTSQADAVTYLADLIQGDAFIAADSATRDKYLVTATRWIDRLAWGGAVAVDGQELAFPRSGLKDRAGADISSASIPLDVKRAQWELAAAIAAGIVDQGGKAGKVQSVTSDGVSVSFSGIGGIPGQELGLPRSVHDLIGYLLEGSQGEGIAGAGAAYGTTDADGDPVESEWADLDKFGRSEPL